MPTSDFLFALCQRGAERALKREVSVTRPSLRPAYQRPGVVTFRSDAPVTEDDRIDAVLARVSGLSLGTERDLEVACARIAALEPPLRLHVIERDLFRADEAPPSHPEGELASATEDALRRALPGVFHEGAVAQPGDLVLDVIVAPGDPILLGLHRHTKDLSPHPGGRYVYEVPADAPSRAFRKTEEALAAFDLPVRAGDVALELGAAPGGGAYALARRGVTVLAVDPADMDSHVLAFEGPGGARVTHLRMTMDAVERRMLPERVGWVLMDVNLAPQVALHAVARITALCRASLLGAIFTLKLNDWSFLDRVGDFVAAARTMGIVDPKVRQLPAHRQEIVLVGLTARGQQRSESERRRTE
ncbi:MAG TPA: SAM-dependent methyltransferase [Planctomycetota bacterium]|nr:SAM-dependent methyltransferase [Planctomycetota bacterium]